MSSNDYKVHVTTLKRDLEGNETEISRNFFRDDVTCIYKDRKGVFLSIKTGYLVKVKHTLVEMESYFLGSLKIDER